MAAKRRKAIFLDRDGTLIHEAHYLSDPKGVRLYKGVPRALALLQRAGFKLIVVSNQSGIGRGWVSGHAVRRINQRMQALLVREGAPALDAIYYCPHAPGDGCACRKPKPLLVQRAARRFHLDLQHSFMIGDKICDMELAYETGIRGLFLLTGHGAGERALLKGAKRARPVYIGRRFENAARWILRNC